MISLNLFHDFMFATIGIIAGLLAGIFGIGGGLVVVPGLLFVFERLDIIPPTMYMQVAAGSSLAVMVITSLSSIKAHHKLSTVKWSAFQPLWPGIMLGTIGGAVLAQWIPTYWLQIFFALFLIVVAIKMWSGRHLTHQERNVPALINFLVSSLIGLKSGLLGVGGGLLLIPYLTYRGIPARQIAPLTNLCTLTVGFIGALSFMITGYTGTSFVAGMTGYVYWPAVCWIALFSSFLAPVGARLSYQLPLTILRYGFIIILLITAIRLLF